MVPGLQIVSRQKQESPSTRERILQEIGELRTAFWRQINALESRVVEAFDQPKDAA